MACFRPFCQDGARFRPVAGGGRDEGRGSPPTSLARKSNPSPGTSRTSHADVAVAALARRSARRRHPLRHRPAHRVAASGPLSHRVAVPSPVPPGNGELLATRCMNGERSAARRDRINAWPESRFPVRAIRLLGTAAEQLRVRHTHRREGTATPHTEGRRLRPGSASTRTARGGRRRRFGNPWAHAAASSGSPAPCRAHLRSPGGNGRRPHFAAAASALLRARGLGDLAIPEAIGGLRSARRPSRTDPARPGTARSHARPCHQPPVGGRALGLPPALRSLELLERDLSELAGTRGRRAVLRALERARRGGASTPSPRRGCA